MTFTANKRFNTTAFAIAAAAVVALHGSMLMGFNQLAINNHDKNVQADTQLAKTTTVRPTVTLERVLITTRRT